MLRHGKLPELLAKSPESPMIFSDDVVILVGGGNVDAAQLRAFSSKISHSVIAVDGGLRHVLGAGLMPALVIGDIDSISPNHQGNGLKILKITDQQTTDFEKALAVVSSPLILGFGFLGHRLDHSLAALHVLVGKPAHAIGRIVLIDPHDAVMFVKGGLSLSLPPLARLSLWPLTRQSFIRSEGLIWPLDGLTLGAGAGLGTSNQVIDGASCQDVLIVAEPQDDGLGDGGFMVMVESLNAGALIDAQSLP